MKRKLLSMILAMSIVAGTVGTGYVCAEETDDTITIEDYGFAEEYEETSETSEESTEVTTEEGYSEETYSEETTSSEEDVITNEGYFEGYESAEDPKEPVVITSVDEVSGALSYSQEFSDVIVNVDAPAGVFPEGTRISVAKRYVSEKVFEEYKDEDTEIKATYSFDIKAYDPEGNEVQPDTEYGTVSVTFAGIEMDENTEVSVYHVSDDLKSVDEVISEDQVNTDSDANEVVVECEHFSVYTVVFGVYINGQLNGREIIASLNERIYVRDILKDAILEKYPSVTYIRQYQTSLSSTTPTNTYTANNVTMLCGTLDESYFQFSETGTYPLNVRFMDADFNNLTSYTTIVFSVQDTTAHDYQMGDNIYGDLDESTGELSIVGTGAMWKSTDIQSNAYGHFEWISSEDEAKIKTITFSNGITEIYGLNSLSALEDVSFPNTLEIIGNSFNNCPCLKKCILPEGFSKIITLTGSSTDGSFNNCTALTEVSLPDSLTKICGGSFRSCTSLEEVTLPANVEMGSECFQFCTGLKRIDIYCSSTSNRLFRGCPADVTVNVYSDNFTVKSNEFFTSGVLFNIHSTHLTLQASNDLYYQLNGTEVVNEVETYAPLFDTATGEYVTSGTISNGLIAFTDTLGTVGNYRSSYGTFSTNSKIYKIHNDGTENVGLLSASTFPTKRFYSSMEKLVIDSGTYNNYQYADNPLFSGKNINIIELNNASFSKDMRLYGAYRRSDTGAYVGKIASNTVYNCTLTKSGSQYVFGTSVYGSYDSSTKTLYVTGTGAMNNSYNADSDVKDEVEHIVVDSGITSFYSGLFFKNHTNLEDVYFDNVTMSANISNIGIFTAPNGTQITSLTNGTTYDGLYTYEATNYQLGTSVYAKFNSTTKTLNVFGTGAMYTASSTNYQSKLADIRDQIEHIVIGEGVTSTGGASSSSASYCARSVFANMPNLTSVIYPSTITEIKQGSFYNCPKYKITEAPAGITTIGKNAVYVPYIVKATDQNGNTLKTIEEVAYYQTNNTIKTYDFSDLGLRTVISIPDMNTDDSIILADGLRLSVSGVLPAHTYIYVLSDKVRDIPDGYHLVNKYNVGLESSWPDEYWTYGNSTDSIVAYLLSNETQTDYKLWFIGSGNMCCLTPKADWYLDIPWFCDVTGYDEMSGESWRNYESGLRMITEIFYSDGITSVSGGYYTGVTSIDLPDSVKYIGVKAFQYSLLEEDSITLNDGLLDIYADAFANTSVLITSFPSSLTSAAQRYGNIPYVVEARDLDGNVLVSKMYYRNATNATQRITLSGYYTYGAEVTNPSLAPADRPEGYTFIKQVTGSQTAYVTKTSELVKFVLLYADNNDLNHTLTFNQYDGTKICDYNYTIGEEFDTPVAGLIAPTETGKTFVFAGWRDENKRLYGDEELKHTLFRSDKVFTAYYTSEDATATYTVTFRDDDNTVITTTEYAYGATVVQPPVSPRKIKNASLMKVFTGWDKPVETTCTKDAEYKATYREEDRTYTVKFVSTDGGTQIYSFDGFKYGDLITSRNAYFLNNIFDDVMVQKSTLEAQGVTQDISTKGYYSNTYYEDFKYATRWGRIENYDPTKLYELTGFKDINDGNKFYSFADLETAIVKNHMYLKPVYEVRDTLSGDYTVKLYNEINFEDPSKPLNYGNTAVGIDTLLTPSDLNEHHPMAEWHIKTGDYWYLPDEYFLYSGDMYDNYVISETVLSNDSTMYHHSGMQIYAPPYKYGQDMTDGYIYMNNDYIILPKYTIGEAAPQTRDVYIFSKQPNTSGGYSDKCVASLNVNVSDTINISDYIADDNANVSVYYSGNNKYVYQNMYYYQDINGKHMINPNGTFTIPRNTDDWIRIYPDYGSSLEYYRVEWLDWNGSIYHTEAVLRNTNLPIVAPPTREDDYYNSYLFDGWANVAGGTVPAVVTGALKLQATYTADYIASSFKVTIPASIALDYNNSNDKFEGNLPVGVTINKNTKDSHPTEYYVAISPESAITLTDSDTSDTLNVDVAMDKKKFYMSDLTQNGSTYTGSEDVNLTADSKVGSFSGNLTIGFRSGYDGE